MPRKKTSKRKPRKTTRTPRRRQQKDVLEERVEHFSKEVEALGNKFGKRMERKGEEWDSWFHNTFGLIGPLISSIIGIIIFGLVVWFVGVVNFPLGSSFLSSLSKFLLENIGWFFLIFLFFSYTSYFSKTSPRGYMPFSPIVAAIGIVIGFWIAAHAINIVNLSLGISILSSIVFYIRASLFWIFWVVLFIGYIVILVKTVSEGAVIESRPARRMVSMRKTTRPGQTHRLYRSGKDKILGGVCGGIAEYLGVDPVIIRLLWIIGTLAWGFGLIAYIIAWIIIPRNPNHRWKD